MKKYAEAAPIAINFTVDVDQGITVKPKSLTIQQGEHNARYFQVSLVHNEMPVNLANSEVHFLTQPHKSDEIPTTTNCEIYDAENGQVMVAVKDYMSNKSGIINGEFVRIGEDGSSLPFKNFTISVDGSIFVNDGLGQSEPLHSLVSALARVQRVEEYLEQEFMDVEAKYAGELSKTNAQLSRIQKYDIKTIMDNTQLNCNNVILQILNEEGNNEIKLYFSKANYDLEADLTIPRSVSMEFTMGAKINVKKGKTLIIQGDIMAGNHVIFDSEGDVVLHNSATAINICWFSGESLNEKWDKIRRTLKPWEPYELLIPKPAPDMQGTKPLRDERPDWIVWKITDSLVFDDNANNGVVWIHGEIVPEGFVKKGLVFSDTEKPENIKFPLGITIMGVSNTDNKMGVGIEICGGARIFFENRIDIQWCDIGLVLGGDNQTRECGQISFEDLHVAYCQESWIELNGNSHTIIDCHFKNTTVEGIPVENKDLIKIIGNIRHVEFNKITHIGNAVEPYIDIYPQNVVVITNSEKDYPSNVRINTLQCDKIRGFGIVTKDSVGASKGDRTIDNTIVGFVQTQSGRALKIAHSKGLRLVSGVSGSDAIVVENTSQFTILNVGNRYGSITDNGDFTLVNNLGAKPFSTGNYPDINGFKQGNLIYNSYDNSVWIRVKMTGVASEDFVKLSS